LDINGWLEMDRMLNSGRTSGSEVLASLFTSGNYILFATNKPKLFVKCGTGVN
jgi:hypothetical protein